MSVGNDYPYRLMFKGFRSDMKGLAGTAVFEGSRACGKHAMDNLHRIIARAMEDNVVHAARLPRAYVWKVLAPTESKRDEWRIRTEVQLVKHPYIAGARCSIDKFLDLVEVVDRGLNNPDDFDEFAGYGYLNAMARFSEEC